MKQKKNLASKRMLSQYGWSLHPNIMLFIWSRRTCNIVSDKSNRVCILFVFLTFERGND